MGKTSIEWTDVSWPIVNGCRRASPGCQACYAERLASTRLSKTKKYGGLAVFKENHGPQWTGEARLWETDLDMPLRLRKPSKIFVADMGDLFYEGVPDEDIAAVFGVMALAPWHTYQVLTKRARRMREWVSMMNDGLGVERCLDALARKIPFALPRHTAQLAREAYQRHGLDHRQDAPWPMPWIWFGVSVEDQHRADERIPHLLAVPAAVRFVSYEPAIGLVDFTDITIPLGGGEEHINALECDVGPDDDRFGGAVLDWIIVGGESGPGARPFDLAWMQSTIEQCGAAGVACFAKQLGARPIGGKWGPKLPQINDRIGRRNEWVLHDPKGGDWNEWPEDLRVREWPR